MRIQIKRKFVLALFLLISFVCMSQPEGTPPPGPPVIPPGLPIDGGLFIGLIFGVFYGTKKIIRSRN